MKRIIGVPSDTYSERDAWFRSPDWDEEAQGEWRKRLAGARPHNKIQYRRIKAIALLDTGDPQKEAAALQMLQFILDSNDATQHQQVMALGILARHHIRTGDLGAAEADLRRKLALAGPDGSGTDTEEEIGLAELLISKGQPDSLREARALLDRRASSPPPFVRSQFRLFVAYARLDLALGDAVRAAGWARKATEIAGIKHSGFANHPIIGLVDLDDETSVWLRRVVAGGALAGEKAPSA